MSWITVINPRAAIGGLKELYQRISGPDGQVDNVLQVHSLRAHSLQGHMALYKAVLHHAENVIPRWFLEALGVYVSRLNSCTYCDRHHSAGLQRLIGTEQDFAALDSALSEFLPGAPFNAREQVAFEYANALTLLPGNVTAALIERLRLQGWSDGEILEINQVCAYFAYANRTVLGLGVDSHNEALGLSPSATDSASDWRHQ